MCARSLEALVILYVMALSVDNSGHTCYRLLRVFNMYLSVINIMVYIDCYILRYEFHIYIFGQED